MLKIWHVKAASKFLVNLMGVHMPLYTITIHAHEYDDNALFLVLCFFFCFLHCTKRKETFTKKRQKCHTETPAMLSTDVYVSNGFI